MVSVKLRFTDRPEVPDTYTSSNLFYLISAAGLVKHLNVTWEASLQHIKSMTAKDCHPHVKRMSLQSKHTEFPENL
jgi:hypothetical protein